VRLVVQDEFEQRDRFMRENLDVLARKLGEMQAKLTQLESLGERVSGLAGVNPAEIKASRAGGALVTGRPLSMEELQATLGRPGPLTDQRTDLLTVLESRLFDQKMRNMMVPTQQPVDGQPGFGFWLAHRSDHRAFGPAYRAGFPGRRPARPSSRRPAAWW
jgi:hypothetical protein